MGSSRATDREAGKGRVVGEQQCEGAGGRARGMLKKLDFILTELNAFCCNSSFRVQGGFLFLFWANGSDGKKKRFYILFLQLFQCEIGIALAPHAHAHSTFPLPLVRLALRAGSFRCWYPSRRIQFQGADALATALLGQQRRLAVRGELAREVGPLGALDS